MGRRLTQTPYKRRVQTKTAPEFWSGAVTIINENLLWPWRWSPLSLFLSALWLLLAPSSWGGRSRPRLPARLTVGALASFSSTLRFAGASGRRGWRLMDPRSSLLSRASRFARPATGWRHARLTESRLSSLFSAPTFLRAWARWRGRSATLNPKRLTAILLGNVRCTTRLTGTWWSHNRSALRWTAMFRRWR